MVVVAFSGILRKAIGYSFVNSLANAFCAVCFFMSLSFAGALFAFHFGQKSLSILIVRSQTGLHGPCSHSNGLRKATLACLGKMSHHCARLLFHSGLHSVMAIDFGLLLAKQMVHNQTLCGMAHLKSLCGIWMSLWSLPFIWSCSPLARLRFLHSWRPCFNSGRIIFHGQGLLGHGDPPAVLWTVWQWFLRRRKPFH